MGSKTCVDFTNLPHKILLPIVESKTAYSHANQNTAKVLRFYRRMNQHCKFLINSVKTKVNLLGSG